MNRELSELWTMNYLNYALILPVDTSSIRVGVVLLQGGDRGIDLSSVLFLKKVY